MDGRLWATLGALDSLTEGASSKAGAQPKEMGGGVKGGTEAGSLGKLRDQ